ncbi:hypothetical protein AB7M49_000774 [Bradyrhizobium elkanii]
MLLKFIFGVPPLMAASASKPPVPPLPLMRGLDGSKNFLQKYSDVKRAISRAEKIPMDPRNVEARDVLISIAEDGDRLSRGEAVLRSDSVGPALAAHGRYRYSAIGQRPDFNWPQGRRLAVYVGLNLEHFAFGDGLGAELCPGGPHPDVLNYAWRDYGNRVGVWRLIELFDELELPLSVLANSSIYHYCPEVMEAFRPRRRSRRSRPHQFRAPGCACARRGASIDRGSDRCHRASRRAAAARLAGTLDFAITGHTRSAGRSRLRVPARLVHGRSAGVVLEPHRLRPLRRALQTILARRDEIWITTAGGIAAFSRALPDGIVPT